MAQESLGRRVRRLVLEHPDWKVKDVTREVARIRAVASPRWIASVYYETKWAMEALRDRCAELKASGECERSGLCERKVKQ